MAAGQSTSNDRLQRSGTERGEFRLFDRKPSSTDAILELIEGLTARPKHVPAKYFYDERGSKLFEAITELPEYYLTRTELALFDAIGPDLARTIGEHACVVEYGSGSSLKIRKLLKALDPEAYVPVDISLEHLEATARELHGDFPALNVYPTCADFSRPFELPSPVADLTKVGFFPGSSIGNFAPRAATEFLRNAARTLGTGSRLIIGVDRKKDVEILEAAYNDAAGVTSEFNLNMLEHVGRLLGAALAREDFAHRARYNPELGAVQMFLEVLRPHRLEVGGETLEFETGEEIHTENSFKYEPEEFLDVAASGGYRPRETWTDDLGWFSVFLLEAVMER
jgi:dimethylhistidine N-methyltransferase